MWASGILGCGLLLLSAVQTTPAAVVDRIAVIVGKKVITESEVLQELRLTEFLNQQPLDLGPQQRRAAAERLVDQQLIRNEVEISRSAPPDARQADDMLQRFREEHYPDDAGFRSALAKYGITEELLKQHFLWQLEAMRFTDLRFGGGSPQAAAPGGADRTSPGTSDPAGTANRAVPGTEALAAPAEAAGVDRQMEAWLKQARSETRVQFRKEAFQ